MPLICFFPSVSCYLFLLIHIFCSLPRCISQTIEAEANTYLIIRKCLLLPPTPVTSSSFTCFSFLPELSFSFFLELKASRWLKSEEMRVGVCHLRQPPKPVEEEEKGGKKRRVGWGWKWNKKVSWRAEWDFRVHFWIGDKIVLYPPSTLLFVFFWRHFPTSHSRKLWSSLWITSELLWKLCVIIYILEDACLVCMCTFNIFYMNRIRVFCLTHCDSDMKAAYGFKNYVWWSIHLLKHARPF